MKKKTLAGLSGQLSRAQMKSVFAGRPWNPDCSACKCNDDYEQSYLQEGSCHCDSGFKLPCSVGTNPQ